MLQVANVAARLAHHTLRACGLLLCAMAIPRGAHGQGEIVGRVLADSAQVPVFGAQLTIARLSRSVVSDSAGRFRFAKLPPGDYVVTLRALGFRPESATVAIDGDEVALHDFAVVRQAQPLPGREITAPRPEYLTGKMAAFHEREKLGVGHFVGRAELAKAEGGMSQTGMVLSKVPGVRVVHGANTAWIASGRAVSGSGCAFCPSPGLNRADIARGAKGACYMDVYLDGILVFDSKQAANGLFDVNSIPPEQIEGIEVYTSASQIPVQYNKTSNGCGVLIIWTRIG
jgi:hypothetical protein